MVKMRRADLMDIPSIELYQKGIEGPSECLWITRPIQATGVVGLWLACVQVALRCCFTWATNKDPCSWIDPHGPRVYDGIMGIPSA